jgi:hypothetical protein
MWTIIVELHTTLNLHLQQLVPETIFARKTYILRQGFKVDSMCVARRRKTAEEIINTIFFKFFGVKKINDISLQ